MKNLILILAMATAAIFALPSELSAQGQQPGYAVLATSKAQVLSDFWVTGKTRLVDVLTLPKFTTLKRNALSPAKGMFLYNTNLDSVQFHNGTSWITLGSGSGGGSGSKWNTAGSNYTPSVAGKGFYFERGPRMQLRNDRIDFDGLLGTVNYAGTMTDSLGDYYLSGIIKSPMVGLNVLTGILDPLTGSLIGTSINENGIQNVGFESDSLKIYQSWNDNVILAEIQNLRGEDASPVRFEMTKDMAALSTFTFDYDTASSLVLWRLPNNVGQLMNLHSEIAGQGPVGYNTIIESDHLRAKMYATNFDNSTTLSSLAVDTLGIFLEAADLKLTVGDFAGFAGAKLAGSHTRLSTGYWLNAIADFSSFGLGNPHAYMGYLGLGPKKSYLSMDSTYLRSEVPGTLILQTDNDNNRWSLGYSAFGGLSGPSVRYKATMYAYDDDINLDVNVVTVDTAAVKLTSHFDYTGPSARNYNELVVDSTGLTLTYGIDGGGTSSPTPKSLSVDSAGVRVSSTTGYFRPPIMTAAQASAITPENGAMVYVTDTDVTFTSVGFWGRVNGTWTALH